MDFKYYKILTISCSVRFCSISAYLVKQHWLFSFTVFYSVTLICEQNKHENTIQDCKHSFRSHCTISFNFSSVIWIKGLVNSIALPHSGFLAPDFLWGPFALVRCFSAWESRERRHASCGYVSWFEGIVPGLAENNQEPPMLLILVSRLVWRLRDGMLHPNVDYRPHLYMKWEW